MFSSAACCNVIAVCHFPWFKPCEGSKTPVVTVMDDVTGLYLVVKYS